MIQVHARYEIVHQTLGVAEMFADCVLLGIRRLFTDFCSRTSHFRQIEYRPGAWPAHHIERSIQGGIKHVIRERLKSIIKKRHLNPGFNGLIAEKKVDLFCKYGFFS